LAGVLTHPNIGMSMTAGSSSTSSTAFGLSPGILSAEQVLQVAFGCQSESGMLVLDIRSRRAFNRFHIPGSHNIPLPLLLCGEPPDADLLLVGDSDHTTKAAILRLHDQGYQRLIRYLGGGIQAWRAESLPLEGSLNQNLLGRFVPLPWASSSRLVRA
jgi:rhodanese-related sulfurtransferase